MTGNKPKAERGQLKHPLTPRCQPTIAPYGDPVGGCGRPLLVHHYPGGSMLVCPHCDGIKDWPNN